MPGKSTPPRVTNGPSPFGRAGGLCFLFERIAGQTATSRALSPDRVVAFGALVREKIEIANIQSCKPYMQALFAGQQSIGGKVRVFLR